MPRMITVALAPDSFKGTLTAEEAAEAMGRGVVEAMPGARLVAMPMADGGEGTAGILARATGGEVTLALAEDPLGRPIRASLGRLGDGVTWAVDTAAASGLTLLAPEERDPLVASSRGTGRLLVAAMDRGAKGILLGLGGSATVDGGAGLVRALGFRFLDAEGEELAPGGGSLRGLSRIDTSRVPARVWDLHGRLRLACDVTNPLVGPRGAARVFGPQKGASPATVALLEEGLERLAMVLSAAQKARLGTRGSGQGSGSDQPEALVDIASLPATGAAGGIGATLKVLLGARLEPGGALVLDIAGYVPRLEACDLVITGEGRMDGQTLEGKAPAAVAAAARSLGLPVLGVTGVPGPGLETLSFVEDWEAARAEVGEALPAPATAAAEVAAATGRLLGRWMARQGLQ